MNPLLELRNHNQSVWLDYIRRDPIAKLAPRTAVRGSVSCSCFSRRRHPRTCRPGRAGAGSRAIPPFSKRPSMVARLFYPSGSEFQDLVVMP